MGLLGWGWGGVLLPPGPEGALRAAGSSPSFTTRLAGTRLAPVSSSCLFRVAWQPLCKTTFCRSLRRGDTRPSPPTPPASPAWGAGRTPPSLVHALGPLFGEGLLGESARVCDSGRQRSPSTPVKGPWACGGRPWRRTAPRGPSSWFSCPGREALGEEAGPPSHAWPPMFMSFRLCGRKASLDTGGTQGPWSCCPGLPAGGEAAHPETVSPQLCLDESGDLGVPEASPPRAVFRGGQMKELPSQPDQRGGAEGPRGLGSPGWAHLSLLLGPRGHQASMAPPPSSSSWRPQAGGGEGAAACRP